MLVIALLLFAFNTRQTQIATDISDSNFKGCLRGNVLRGQVNKNIEVLSSVLDTTLELIPKESKTYKAYAAQRALLRTVPIPNCKRVTFRPGGLWP